MKKITLFAFFISILMGNAQTLTGTWKISPQAGAFTVGPGQGSSEWYKSTTEDVTARACLFDDEYVFTAAGGFSNVQGAQTWIESWQGGGTEGCRAPVAPHNGSNAATYIYDAAAKTLVINGKGAYLGLSKAINGAELTDPAAAPTSIAYTVTSLTATEMTLDIAIAGAGWWRFKFSKQGAVSPIDGTWKMLPQAGAFTVGPGQGNSEWFASKVEDVTTRACLFDDEYVFTAAGGFSNVQGAQTWIESWQGGGDDGCRAAVAPHNGSNAATYTYDAVTKTLVINGKGAYLGLSKAINGAELTDPAAAPNSITYTVTSLTATEMTLDIAIAGPGWWRFKMLKQGTPTCNDGIKNGDETGIDCGGASCPACVTPPTVAASTPPARPTADVVSIFSDAYANRAVKEWGPNWGDSSARINDFTVQTNPTKIMDVAAGKTFAGIDFSPSLFDATTFTNFHLDYYISSPLPAGQVMSIKLSNHNGGAGETSAIEFTPSSLSAGQWVSLDIPLSNFVAASVPANLARNAVAQIAISVARADNGVPVKIYMDNIYFHKNTTLSTESFSGVQAKLYPNPVANVLNIEAASKIEKISVYTLLGQEVISKVFNDTNAALDVSSLRAGMYVVKAQIDGVTATSKFIKK